MANEGRLAVGTQDAIWLLELEQAGYTPQQIESARQGTPIEQLGAPGGIPTPTPNVGGYDIANFGGQSGFPNPLAANSWVNPSTGETHYFDENWNWLYSSGNPNAGVQPNIGGNAIAGLGGNLSLGEPLPSWVNTLLGIPGSGQSGNTANPQPNQGGFNISQFGGNFGLPNVGSANSWTDPSTGQVHYYDDNWNWLYSSGNPNAAAQANQGGNSIAGFGGNLSLGPNTTAANSWTDPATGEVNYYDDNWNWLYSSGNPNAAAPQQQQASPGTPASVPSQAQRQTSPSQPTAIPVTAGTPGSAGIFQQGTWIPNNGVMGRSYGPGMYSLVGVPGTFVTTPSGQTYNTHVGTSMHMMEGDIPTGVGGETLELGGFGLGDWFQGTSQQAMLAFLNARNAARQAGQSSFLLPQEMWSNPNVPEYADPMQSPIVSRNGPASSGGSSALHAAKTS